VHPLEEDADGLSVELALGAKRKADVLHLLLVIVRRDLEGHEVDEVLATGLLQLRKHVLRRAHHAEVDVLGGARSVEA
jgi:hypothetical protein